MEDIKTTIVFMDQSGKIIRIKDLSFYPCVLFTSAGALRVYEDYSDPDKDVLSLEGVKKIHAAGPGIGSIIEAQEIRSGANVLYSIISRYLWIRRDPGYEGKDPHYYIRADDNLPAGARLKIEVE